ncbi:MAG: hypothetical protein K8R75_04375 [Deltaproteobacteria bacterium]|nr:hypothetical protein [Deltaproteobacteria bacterium]MDL1964382.1 hypothetical protein [Deltaproteobacteria bacterium]
MEDEKGVICILQMLPRLLPCFFWRHNPQQRIHQNSWPLFLCGIFYLADQIGMAKPQKLHGNE